MSAREKQIPSLLIDVDFWQKDEILTIKGTWSDSLAIATQRLLFWLFNRPDSTASERAILALHSDFGVDRTSWTEVIEYLCGPDSNWLSRSIDGRIVSERLQKERNRVMHLRAVAVKNGSKGGKAKRNRSKIQAVANPPSEQSPGNPSVSVSVSVLDPVSKKVLCKPPPEELVQYGDKHIRMTMAQMDKLIEKFGPALVSQEVSEADEWIDGGQTKNARRYQNSDHNHYTFMRCTWLPNKRLKRDSNGYVNGHSQAFAHNMAERERLVKLEKEGML